MTGHETPGADGGKGRCAFRISAVDRASWLMRADPPLSQVSFARLRCSWTGLRAASETRYLKWCIRRRGSCGTRVTCAYPLVAPLLSSEPRREPHVNDMSPTQNPCPTRA